MTFHWWRYAIVVFLLNERGGRFASSIGTRCNRCYIGTSASSSASASSSSGGCSGALILVVLDDVGLDAVFAVEAEERALLVELAVLAVGVLGHAVVLVVELAVVEVELRRSGDHGHAASAALGLVLLVLVEALALARHDLILEGLLLLHRVLAAALAHQHTHVDEYDDEKGERDHHADEPRLGRHILRQSSLTTKGRRFFCLRTNFKQN